MGFGDKPGTLELIYHTTDSELARETRAVSVRAGKYTVSEFCLNTGSRYIYLYFYLLFFCIFFVFFKIIMHQSFKLTDIAI